MADKKNTIGRFEILEKIGEGPIGAVYKASDPVIRRIVAIKVVKLYALEETTSFAEVFEKIYRVVRTSTSLNHPNICIIYDLSEEKKIPFITMEYVEGQDLDSLLQKKHQFKRVQLLNVLSQICDALDFAHRKNVIHQDLKTTNVLVTPEMIVKITDFGIAGLDEIAAAQTKKLLSIPFYISPEQAIGEKVSTASDLFSLGVIVYQLLCGELPFRGNTTANVVMTIAKEAPAAPKDIEKSGINKNDWDNFFATALAKAPEKRFQTANELFEALNNLIPPSDHSYFPYTFSGSENDKTGEFEKTFIGEIAQPTVLIDAKQLFKDAADQTRPQGAAQEPEPLPEPELPELQMPAQAAPAPEPEPHLEEQLQPAAAQEFSEQDFPEIEPRSVEELGTEPTIMQQPPVAAEVASDMPEDDMAETMLAPPISQAPPSPPAPAPEPAVNPNDQTGDERKEQTLAPATQLIEMPSELKEEAVAKSNGSGSVSQELLQQVEPVAEQSTDSVHTQAPESSHPTVLIQGTGAIVDHQAPPHMEPVRTPTQPRMIRPQEPVPAPPPPIGVTQQRYVAPRKAAGPPNLKRYLIAAIIVALFILAVGGYILMGSRKPEVTAHNNGTQPANNTSKGAASHSNTTGNAVENSGGQPAAATITGIITVGSTPPGAKVLINGEDKGVTPLQLSDMPAGHYDVQLQLNGYKDAEQSFDLNEQNQSPQLQTTLEKAAPVTGTLVIESTPTNAFIVISNRVVGVTPKTIANFKTGKYTIVLKKDGYQDYSGNVRVNPDKTAALRAELVEIPKPPPPVVETKKPEPTVVPGSLVTLGPDVVAPKAIKREYARYPEVARQHKIEGTISMSVLVSEKGEVLDIKVLQSPSKVLEDAAVAAVKKWVYQPATKQGVVVKVWTPVSMAFQYSR